jgi:hypothetical protein
MEGVSAEIVWNPELQPGGKIGTAHNSIDRPLDPAHPRPAGDRRRRVS